MNAVKVVLMTLFWLFSNTANAWNLQHTATQQWAVGDAETLRFALSDIGAIADASATSGKGGTSHAESDLYIRSDYGDMTVKEITVNLGYYNRVVGTTNYVNAAIMEYGENGKPGKVIFQTTSPVKSIGYAVVLKTNFRYRFFVESQVLPTFGGSAHTEVQIIPPVEYSAVSQRGVIESANVTAGSFVNQPALNCSSYQAEHDIDSLTDEQVVSVGIAQKAVATKRNLPK